MDDGGSTLMSLTDVAVRAQVSRPAVSNWRRRYDDFPVPVQETSSGALFLPADVHAWMKRHGKRFAAPSVDQMVWSALNIIRGHARPDEAARAGMDWLGWIVLSKDGAEKDQLRRSLDHATSEDYERITDRLLYRTEAELHTRLFQRERMQHSWRPLAEFLREVDALAGTFGVDSAFEGLVAATARGGLATNGHATPASIAQLTTALMTPVHGTVLDPACGYGSMLLAASQSNAGPQRLIGYEINDDACRVARLRMLVHGIAAEIFCRDSLEADVDTKCDFVVADPPFGMSSLSRRYRPFGNPPPSRSDLAWVQDSVSRLNSDGMAVHVTAMGPLTRNGPERAIRRGLIESGCVDAIIALPAALYPHTRIPVAVWILRKPQDNPPREVLLIDASDMATTTGRTLKYLSTEDIGRIASCYRDRGVKVDSSLQSASVSLSDLDAENYVLLPARWLTRSASLDSDAFQKNITAMHAELKATRIVINRDLSIPMITGVTKSTYGEGKPTRIRDLGFLERGKFTGADEPPPGSPTVPLVRGQNLAPDFRVVAEDLIPIDLAVAPTQVTLPGDILISGQPRIRAAVDELGGHAVSSSLFVLRPTLHVAPLVLAALITQAAQVEKGLLAGGIAVGDLPVNLPTPETASALSILLHDLSAHRRAAERAITAIDEMTNSIVGATAAGLGLTLAVED